jgi:cell division protein ZapA (FtsZ GTPase activity inhibitor)
LLKAGNGGFTLLLDQLLTIDVLGQPFTFRSDSNVTDAKAVADYVTQAVSKIDAQTSKKNPPLDKRAILVLAALNITNEYFELQKEYQQLLQDITRRSANLLKTLETQLS